MVIIKDYNLVMYILISNNFRAATVFAYGQTASGKTFVSDIKSSSDFFFFFFFFFFVLKMLVFIDYGKIHTIKNRERKY